MATAPAIFGPSDVDVLQRQLADCQAYLHEAIKSYDRLLMICDAYADACDRIERERDSLARQLYAVDRGQATGSPGEEIAAEPSHVSPSSSLAGRGDPAPADDPSICPECEGLGYVDCYQGEGFEACKTCDGTGYVEATKPEPQWVPVPKRGDLLRHHSMPGVYYVERVDVGLRRIRVRIPNGLKRTLDAGYVMNNFRPA